MRQRLGRPCLRRKIKFNPEVKYFKPRGIKMSDLDVVELKAEELEAIRLKNIEELDQRQCAEIMHTSPATFQRILSKANKKIASALVQGNAIKIIDN